MSISPRRVVIVGGGVAALETLMALRSLGGDRVELVLVAPDEDFVYRPLSTRPPYSVGRPRRTALRSVARDAHAAFLPATVERVETKAKTIATSGDAALDYDALVLAVGARATPVVPHAITWDDRSSAELLGGLLADIDEGYTRSVAVVIPPGPSWPLRAYELALVIAREGKGMSAGVETTIVSPDPSPLELLGARAVEAISEGLAAAGIAVASADHVEVEPGHTTALLLQPSGRRLETDRLVALPALAGRPIPGIPADRGFIDIDEHGRVRGIDGVWSAGDGTAFPLKSAGVAIQQAEVAAADIAASAGATLKPWSFDAVDRAKLAGLPSDSYLEKWLGEGDDGTTAGQAPPEHTVLTYLDRDLAVGWRGRG